jgi:hypothetical protein
MKTITVEIKSTTYRNVEIQVNDNMSNDDFEEIAIQKLAAQNEASEDWIENAEISSVMR